MDASSTSSPKRAWFNWYFPAWVFLMLAYFAFRDGFTVEALIIFGRSLAWLAVTGLAGWFATKLSRPLLTYYLLAVILGVFALLFVALPAIDGKDVTIGAVFWLGMAILGLVWCIYYERTEPLR